MSKCLQAAICLQLGFEIPPCMWCSGKADDVSRQLTRWDELQGAILTEWFGRVYPTVLAPEQGMKLVEEYPDAKGKSIGYVYTVINPFCLERVLQREHFGGGEFQFGQILYVGSTTVGAERIRQHWIHKASGQFAQYAQKHTPFSFMWEAIMWEISDHIDRKLHSVERGIRGFLSPVIQY